MSFFAVTIEEISEIRAHSNADRLAVASLKGLGYQFIVGKDTWQVGDKCLYFPLDAILPEPMLKALGVEGKLAGGKKNRVKTIKLRGEISQGLIGSLSLIADLPDANRTPEEITKFLGVTKYEPEIELPTARDARLIDLPQGVSIYDIENSERFSSAYDALLDQPVWITEKLEGSHIAIAIIEGKEWVCQRRFALEPLPDKPVHFFWEAANKHKLIELAREIYAKHGCTRLIMRGEIIGPNIQSNIYRLPDREVRFFDVMINGRYLAAQHLIELFRSQGREELLVPTISYGETLRAWLAGRGLREASTGDSVLYKTLREGIVIKPLEEQYSQEMSGRLIIKQISPEYLAAA
ncbi:MAG: RNA ligase (ATP) [Pseudomonadota bacterium]|jgi:RNA ligase (TIGR02306 family)